MKVTLFVACEAYSIDAQTNKASVFGILEDYNAAAYPFVIPRLSFVAGLTRDAESSDNPSIILVFKQGDEEVWRRDIVLQFGGRPRLRLAGELGSLLIKTPGPLLGQILHEGKVIGEWLMSMNLLGPGGQIIQPTSSTPVGGQAWEMVSR